MGRTLLAVVVALLVMPAWGSNPGEPLDCSDWVFVEPGLSCQDFGTARPGGIAADRAFDNEGYFYRVQLEILGPDPACPDAYDIKRVNLLRYDGATETTVAYAQDRCFGGNDVDYITVLSAGGGSSPVIFDPSNGRMVFWVQSGCYSPCSYAERTWLPSIGGFTTTFEILQTYEPPAGPIGFRVPYMPEGFQFADWFDSYYGTLATVGDWSQLQPLQCGYPASSPSVGDYLTVADPLPTPSPGNGYYYVTAVNYMGETRYGRRRSGGVLSGRDPAVLPGCAE